jgi:hypothetical protein
LGRRVVTHGKIVHLVTSWVRLSCSDAERFQSVYVVYTAFE